MASTCSCFRILIQPAQPVEAAVYAAAASWALQPLLVLVQLHQDP